MTSTILWPYAWKEIERRNNHFSYNANGIHPEVDFGNTKYSIRLRDQHTWGCPVYVLSDEARDLKSPKWDAKARVGVFLGYSQSHAGSVALVLNPRTLHVSPQYHVIFDDTFSTVPFLRRSEKPPNWTDLCMNSRAIATNEDYDDATRWATEPQEHGSLSSSAEGAGDFSSDRSNPVPSSSMVPNSSDSEGEIQLANQLKSSPPSASGSEGAEVTRDKSNSNSHKISSLDNISRRTSSRTHKPTSRMKNTYDKTLKKTFGLLTIFGLVCNSAVTVMHSLKPISYAQRVVLQAERLNTMYDGTINSVHHAFASMTGADNGVYTLKDVFKQDDRADFVAAMINEVEDHESREHWTMIPRSNMPAGAKSILSIWSFKRKRFPDGRVMKHKARLCAHGGMQTWGENYWETYAPVVNWLSVRILMIVSIIHDLETRSMDFILAFPQAELDTDVFMELPFGFEAPCGNNKAYVLKLNKSLYGLKQAAHNWFKTLDKGLQDRGFKPSNIDRCVYLRKDCIVLVYVDECVLIQRKNSTSVDSLIHS